MENPRVPHYDAVIKVLKYLKGTAGQGIFLPISANMELIAYADANWNTISRSSAESEYRAMAAVVCELTWIRYLLYDLHLTIGTPSTLYCDNKAALHIAANPVFHERTKHIELDCHVVYDKISEGQVKTAHVFSSFQLADLLTKPLHSPTFNRLLLKMGVINI
ncbi:hypothetical protein F2P56_007693 [Juglans regia]|uniref:Secreted RxLR effector protein 161-like n=1 Tax=Juglans regia TaxID=51240 RepID=A0A834D4W3_JUGRE|nr:hypothetical protein F2P56_007693 [Juglans regia]